MCFLLTWIAPRPFFPSRPLVPLFACQIEKEKEKKVCLEIDHKFLGLLQFKKENQHKKKSAPLCFVPVENERQVKERENKRTSIIDQTFKTKRLNYLLLSFFFVEIYYLLFKAERRSSSSYLKKK